MTERQVKLQSNQDDYLSDYGDGERIMPKSIRPLTLTLLFYIYTLCLTASPCLKLI